MRKYISLTALSALCAASSASLQAQSPPNIILFLVDDMGWQDTSLPFWSDKTPLNRHFRTPNMERLAAQGMIFTQAYACSVSSPTRVSLMTGMNAARHRVTNWTLRQNTSTDAASDTLHYPPWNVNGLSPQPGVERTVYATPLPQLLAQGGYHTIHCGKAHFGAIATPGANPHTLGFEVNIAGHAAGGLASYYGEQNYGNKSDGLSQSPFAIPGLEPYWGSNVFVTEALTREAIFALDRARSNPATSKSPFFLYMAHYAVHIPIMPDPRFIANYPGNDAVENAYATLVEGMDKSLGDLMDYLDKNGLTQNTLIVFMSDNGGLSASDRGGALHRHNAPLNSGKGSVYEGGIRVPMIVAWPGKVASGTQCQHPVIIEDFYPTLLEAAGTKASKPIQEIDGVSFLPLLAGREEGDAERPLYWHFPNNWGPMGPGIGASSAVRQGDYKLIYYHQRGNFELFDLRNDIGEQCNIAAARPEVVRRLSHLLGSYLEAVAAQMPTRKGETSPIPYPHKL